MKVTDANAGFELRDGIYCPASPVVHREEEYDSHAFKMLRAMQDCHFWYRGRHRFLLHAVHRQLALGSGGSARRVVDLGGGCGGWVSYFHGRKHCLVDELALADSSLTALRMAGDYLPEGVNRYQVDLLELPWTDRWEMCFLLDVLEHIPDDRGALCQIRRALVPGGLLFVTVPALQYFWTWNDKVARHRRRYARADFRRLAGECDLELLDARYFMFLLSPLLVASRWLAASRTKCKSETECSRLAARMHRVPTNPLNWVLGRVFASETPLGHWFRFPWGTSLLAVLRRCCPRRRTVSELM